MQLPTSTYLCIHDVMLIIVLLNVGFTFAVYSALHHCFQTLMWPWSTSWFEVPCDKCRSGVFRVKLQFQNLWCLLREQTAMHPLALILKRSMLYHGLGHLLLNIMHHQLSQQKRVAQQGPVGSGQRDQHEHMFPPKFF